MIDRPHNMRANTPQQQAMTLVELLVGIAIILIIVPVLYASIETLYSTHARTLARALVLRKPVNATQEIARDFRGAMYSESGSLPLVEMSTSTVTIYADTDLDRTVERVRYFLVDGVLYRGIVEPTATSSYPIDEEVVTELCSDVDNVERSIDTFRYFDAIGTEISSPTEIMDVRRLKVTITSSTRQRNETGDVMVTTSASMRNFKSNY